MSTLATICRVSLYLSPNILVTLYDVFILPYCTHCVVGIFIPRQYLIIFGTSVFRIMQWDLYLINYPELCSSEYCLCLLNWKNLFQQHCVCCLSNSKVCSQSSSCLCIIKDFNQFTFDYISTQGRDNLHLFRSRTDFGKIFCSLR